MSEINVNDPGVPFVHFYALPDGVRIPALHPKDVEMEGGTVDGASPTEKLRDSVQSTVAPAHRPLLASLTYHELQVMQAAYTGWLGAYYMAISKLSAGAVAKPAPTPAPALPRALPTQRPQQQSRPDARSKGKVTIEQPFVELVPGKPLPGILGAMNWGTKEAAAKGPFRFKAPIGQQVALSN